jgi:hypothetical protein
VGAASNNQLQVMVTTRSVNAGAGPLSSSAMTEKQLDTPNPPDQLYLRLQSIPMTVFQGVAGIFIYNID